MTEYRFSPQHRESGKMNFSRASYESNYSTSSSECRLSSPRVSLSEAGLRYIEGQHWTILSVSRGSRSTKIQVGCDARGLETSKYNFLTTGLVVPTSIVGEITCAVVSPSMGMAWSHWKVRSVIDAEDESLSEGVILEAAVSVSDKIRFKAKQIVLLVKVPTLSFQ